MREKNKNLNKKNLTSNITHHTSRTNKGITLIALVITIIVMLILVAVTITVAVNGGLFGYAGNARLETEREKEAEQKLASGAINVDGKKYDSPEDYINGYESGAERFSAIYKETTEYKENGVTTAWIPKGFAVGTSEGINKVADGLVIQDEKGNQFVWIPVEDGVLNVENWNGSTTFSDSAYHESLDSNLASSVSQYKGFYIGRYEAGSITERTSSSDATTKAVVQKGAYPYNCVAWEDNNTNNLKGAVTLCSEIYTDSNKYGVTSTLCYGAQWDEMLRFIADEAHNVTNSTTWGNYNNNTFTFTGKYAVLDTSNWTLGAFSQNEVTNETKPKDTASWLLTTGASETNKAKNIYDFAGNLIEWTMEAHSSNYRVFRGGYYFGSGSGYPASFRNNDIPTNSSRNVGFRPTLYIR